MSQLTTAEMIRNVEIAQSYWKTIPKKNVFERLNRYLRGEHKADVKDRKFAASQSHNCETVACFGGWVPAMPEFAAMGVRAEIWGAPTMRVGSRTLDGSDVAGHLFGKEALFHSRGDCEYDWTFVGSDHALVANRLKKHLAVLKKKATSE